MKASVSIFWFRRDLRLEDNVGLLNALKQSSRVLPIFIFDKYILDDLHDKADARVQFIYNSLLQLQDQLSNCQSSLEVYYGYPVAVFQHLMEKYIVEAVFINHDYEPYANERDQQIRALLAAAGIPFHSFKDQVIFEKKEVVKQDDSPYTVFTPYAKKWINQLARSPIELFNNKKYYSNFYRQPTQPLPDLPSMGFSEVRLSFPSIELETDLLNNYNSLRNFPAANGTSRLGVHLRFGTISIRKLAKAAIDGSKTYLNELIWRDFYQMILWNFPQIGKGRSFKPEYDQIEWRNNESEFLKWTEGLTGYPIVDAGMRELNATGFMHNRVRMVVASFLTKHLLIDWRWGEAYFAQKLLDFDFASNNGGWQWASGSGCDSAPYFRIFNPYVQTKKFDPQLTYISKWVPEFQEFSYPKPIVQHEFARERCLEVYKKAVSKR